ncbi:phosphate ABC transporter permease subunit PstC [Botrimarina sp.]|uniref:phosphate ABC transporter permease subunit PstC n=1 Tax=Botrimarina sp. TaxID=2795802 RepID=UPI0032EB0683
MPSAPSPAEAPRVADALRRESVRIGEGAIHVFLWCCAAVSVLTTIGIVLLLLAESLRFFEEVSLWEFLTATRWTPQFSNDPRFGILPLFCGTLLVTGGAILLAAPLGLGTAIYLSEYASPAVRETVKPLLEVLAGIPSVVYGVIAVTTVSPIVRATFNSDSIFNALSASIVVGFMIMPTIISLSEDVLRSVPRDLRSAAYALGATKYDVTAKVVVPAALSGIVASFLLAISRAVGETMAVTLAAGTRPNMTLNPLEGVQTMTAAIVNISSGDAPAGSLEYRTIFAVGLALFVCTMALNLLAQSVLGRMREKYE